MISIIGSGKVGSSTASLLAQNGLDVNLFDTVPGLAKGEALDLSQSGFKKDVGISGSDRIGDIRDSEIVVITSGSPREVGMSRLELIERNLKIVKENAEAVKKYARDSIVIVVTNPVDVMTYTVLKTSGFPKERVFGMGSLLDSLRFSYFLSREFRIERKYVKALVIGEHGEHMTPLKTHSFIKDKPLEKLRDREKINRAIEKTKGAAEEIIKLKGSTRHAPSSAVFMMVKSILGNRRVRLSAQCFLDGEYGFENLCIGVPAVLGREGIKKIIELDISKEEREEFSTGADKIKNTAGKFNL